MAVNLSRIRDLLARPFLFPGEADELRRLAREAGIQLIWEEYRLDDPWAGWRRVDDGSQVGAIGSR